MNRTRIVKSSLLIVVVFAALIGAVVVAQGTALNSSTTPSAVTRQPRPHPKSHIKISESGNAILYPRPHPSSHIKIADPGSTLIPRPHPKSHIRLTATATWIGRP